MHILNLFAFIYFHRYEVRMLVTVREVINSLIQLEKPSCRFQAVMKKFIDRWSYKNLWKSSHLHTYIIIAWYQCTVVSSKSLIVIPFFNVGKVFFLVAQLINLFKRNLMEKKKTSKHHKSYLDFCEFFCFRKIRSAIVTKTFMFQISNEILNHQFPNYQIN